MSSHLTISTEKCSCGESQVHFTHTCSGGCLPIYGCPKCDNFCPLCENTAPDPDKTLTVDEVIASLLEFKQLHGGDSILMICMNGAQTAYLPISEISVDSDEPCNPVALCCVAEGNHPLGNTIKLRPHNWQWRGKE